MTTQPDAGPLAEAALAIEAALRGIEAAAKEVFAVPLTSERKLRQAADRLQALAGADERLRGPLEALATAMAALLERQRGVAEALQARATELVERRAALDRLLERYRALGAEAAELNGALKGSRDLDVASVAARLGGLAGAAEALSTAAFDQRFPELGHEIHGLRQALLSSRNRLDLLASRPPPGAAAS